MKEPRHKDPQNLWIIVQTYLQKNIIPRPTYYFTIVFGMPTPDHVVPYANTFCKFKWNGLLDGPRWIGDLQHDGVVAARL
jgi:hypothetical protein